VAVEASYPVGLPATSPCCVVLLGAPGSGKGTQAEILAQALNVPIISTGEMLRQAVAVSSPLGLAVKDILASGKLVDDDTMAALIRDRLTREDSRRGFILDGFPRTVAQADKLQGILQDSGLVLNAVIQIDVPESVLVSRALSRQRADDTEEVIRQRLDVYRELTQPLIAYYRDRNLLREVDGHQTIDDVGSNIRQALREEN